MTTVYLQIDKNVKVTDTVFVLKELGKVSCQDKALEVKLKLLKIPSVQVQGPGRYVFSVLDVIEVIQKEYPSVEVNNLGETDFVVTVEKKKKPSQIWQWTKTVFVCVLAFFGAAFSIMAFNNDVGVTELFSRLYQMFTDAPSDGFTVLEITYSAGLGLGIVLFFNHFGRKKITADPTPLEVQMRLYEDEVDTTIIEAENRKKEN